MICNSISAIISADAIGWNSLKKKGKYTQGMFYEHKYNDIKWKNEGWAKPNFMDKYGLDMWKKKIANSEILNLS